MKNKDLGSFCRFKPYFHVSISSIKYLPLKENTIMNGHTCMKPLKSKWENLAYLLFLVFSIV